MNSGTPKYNPEILTPRDMLVHLQIWLIGHVQCHTQHFGHSDPSGHPHGYAGVVIPEWDVRQRIEDVGASLEATPLDSVRKQWRVMLPHGPAENFDTERDAVDHANRNRYHYESMTADPEKSLAMRDAIKIHIREVTEWREVSA